MSSNRTLAAAALAAFLAAQAAPALEEQSAQGLRYLSGGVGQTEASAMREAAPKYSLNLLFTSDRGRYMAAVRVSVRKGNGDEVLSTVSDGPMLLVDLPPGSYTVEAAAEGTTLTRKVRLAKGERRQLVMRWPPGADAEPPPAASGR